MLVTGVGTVAVDAKSIERACIRRGEIAVGAAARECVGQVEAKLAGKLLRMLVERSA